MPNVFAIISQYTDELCLYEYVENSPTIAVDALGLAPAPSLKSKAINALTALDTSHSPYTYYWVTNFITTMSNLFTALNWLKPSQYIHSVAPWYHTGKHEIHLDNIGSLLPTNVFHEAIHAYNDMKKYGLSPRADEGIAYAAGRMLWTLDWLQFVEKELKKSKPAREKLKDNWDRAWNKATGANGVIGWEGRYQSFIWSWKTFQVDEFDVVSVEFFLGWDLTCNALAHEYNVILKNKGICWQFTCETKSECPDDLVLSEELHWVFR
jgi:hypothetical protein